MADPVQPSTTQDNCVKNDVNQVKTKRNRTKMDDILDSPMRSMIQ